MELDKVQLVTLHWDEDREAIGLLPVKNDPFAVKLNWVSKEGARYLCAIGFIRHFDVQEVCLGRKIKPKFEKPYIVIPFGKS